MLGYGLANAGNVYWVRLVKVYMRGDIVPILLKLPIMLINTAKYERSADCDMIGQIGFLKLKSK